MPVFTPEGPDLPLEVLNDLDDGKLVLFCGAGISIGTGLPSFAGLASTYTRRWGGGGGGRGGGEGGGGERGGRGGGGGEGEGRGGGKGGGGGGGRRGEERRGGGGGGRGGRGGGGGGGGGEGGGGGRGRSRFEQLEKGERGGERVTLPPPRIASIRCVPSLRSTNNWVSWKANCRHRA